MSGLIPKTFHFVWLSGESKPPAVKRAISTWSEKNPEFLIREWTLVDVNQFAEDLPAFFQQAVNFRKWAFATDVLRLYLLHRFGGIYLDGDVVAHRAVDSLMKYSGFMSWESDKLLGPHVIGSIPGSAIIKLWFDAYCERSFFINDDFLNQSPMPDVITNVAVSRFRLRRDGFPQIISDDFHILSPSIATSHVNDECIFEHLYIGGWLDQAQSAFAADLARRNKKLLRSGRRLSRRLKRLASRLFGDRVDDVAQRRDFDKNLCFRQFSDFYAGEAHRIRFSSVQPRSALYKTGCAQWGDSLPKVSVIVPIYNVELYLAKCLSSLESQTYGRCDFILVDDGSTDGSGAIAQRVCERDNRFKYFHHENVGLGRSRNRGVQLSDGELLAFVDADDWVSPNFVRNMVEQISGNIDVVACDYCRVLPDGRPLGEMKIGEFQGEVSAAKQLLMSEADCFAWNKLYKREAFDRSGFEFGDGWFEDLAVVPALVGAARNCAFTRQTDYYYVQRPNSILATQFHEPWKNLQIFDAFEKLVDKQGYFSHENWSYYYDWKIVQHLLLFRLPAMRAQVNPDLRGRLMRAHAEKLNSAVPRWTETLLVRQFLSTAKGRERRKRHRAIDAFANGLFPKSMLR